ncbi:zinc finger protein 346-like [Diorhabda carinulata]|uniref:zinc finger protein 346-like n=1 Tax=Diorhabda sublineata TaxID=1163346 RepID=UPI0024E0A844|nr:zinc finger protein 346-like [Diorhabda sublineata]XP_057665085.1 zinc finger protein 346-like [Diorhabda carinulata]
MLSTLYLMVYSVAVEMSGEIHNRIEELPQNFSNQKTISDDDLTDKENRDESKTRIQSLSCEICKVKVTSSKIFQRHLDGRKHKLRAERQGKIFKCELCDIIANSEIQLEIHLRSARHKAKLHKKEHPHFSLFASYTSKTSILMFFCFICIILNLFLLFK